MNALTASHVNVKAGLLQLEDYVQVGLTEVEWLLMLGFGFVILDYKMLIEI